MAQVTQDRENIQVEPAFQEYVLNEGVATVSGQIKVSNLTNTDQTFQVFAADIQQYDSDGQVILADKPLSGADYTLADFIQLDSSSSAIPAQQSAEIHFTIRNSPDLQPGGHYSALVIRSIPSADKTDQQVLQAISSFLLIRKVGGEHFNISLRPTSIAQKSITFSFPKMISLTFNNQGNTHLTPHGLVEFTDMFGKVTHKGIINENSIYVLPSTQRDIPVEVKQMTWNLPVMLYTVSISGTTNPGDVQFSEKSSLIYIHPAVPLTFIILVVLFITFGLKLVRSRHVKK